MEFNNKKIEELITKYNEATTTLDEEKYLRQYFTTQEVAPHLQQYKVLFGYFKQAKTEQLSQPIALPLKKMNYKWLSAAAVMVFAVGFYAQYTFSNAKQQEKEVLLAYQETKTALQLLSNNLNAGTQQVSYLTNFETTTNQIFKIKNNQ